MLRVLYLMSSNVDRVKQLAAISIIKDRFAELMALADVRAVQHGSVIIYYAQYSTESPCGNSLLLCLHTVNENSGSPSISTLIES